MFISSATIGLSMHAASCRLDLRWLGGETGDNHCAEKTILNSDRC